jgi:hypothetical protein
MDSDEEDRGVSPGCHCGGPLLAIQSARVN